MPEQAMRLRLRQLQPLPMSVPVRSRAQAAGTQGVAPQAAQGAATTKGERVRGAEVKREQKAFVVINSAGSIATHNFLLPVTWYRKTADVEKERGERVVRCAVIWDDGRLPAGKSGV